MANQLINRMNEIKDTFDKAGFTTKNGKYLNIVSVKTKSGDWTYDLKKPIVEKVLNAIRKKNNMSADTFIAYGKKAYDNAVEQGLEKKAKTILSVTSVIEANCNKILEAEYGYLAELQIEFFEIIAEMKATKDKMDNLDVDVTIDEDDDNLELDLGSLNL